MICCNITPRRLKQAKFLWCGFELAHVVNSTKILSICSREACSCGCRLCLRRPKGMCPYSDAEVARQAEAVKEAGGVSWPVSWCFEPSQPQRITSRLKPMFTLSPIYSALKSSNHKLSINHKISPDTNLHKTKHTQTSNTKFSKN